VSFELFSLCGCRAALRGIRKATKRFSIRDRPSVASCVRTSVHNREPCSVGFSALVRECVLAILWRAFARVARAQCRDKFRRDLGIIISRRVPREISCCYLSILHRVDPIYELPSNARSLLIPHRCRSDDRADKATVSLSEEDFHDYANHARQGSPIKLMLKGAVGLSKEFLR